MADAVAAPAPEPPADLGLIRLLDEGGVWAPGTPPPDPGLAERLFREMVRVRRIDERMLARQRQGRIGFYGPATGQEAPPVAAGLALAPGDWVFPALREAACMLVRGFPLTRWLAQVFGNDADLQRGRQMPSHMAGRAVHQVSWSSCIGPQLPQAVGAAMAARHRGHDTVVLAFCGDGATSQGDFHHALELAGRFAPPVVLVCQNNHWSISVPVAQQTASKTLAVKARAYDLPGVRVDGNDALAVHKVLREAVDWARRGGGPTFVEAVTYRIGPHSSSDDPSRYRTEDEVSSWRARDPILRLETYLRGLGVVDDARREALDAALDQELDAALAAVEPRPLPARETLFDDVFRAPLPPHLLDQRRALAAAEAPPSTGGR